MTNLDNLIENWSYHNNRTLEFLNFVTQKDLSYKPTSSSKTLGWLLNHVADVREIYVRAFENNGNVSWDEKLENSDNETDIDKLRTYYHSIEDRFNNIIKKVNGEDILNWDEMDNPTVSLALQYMTEHEIYHQGIWSVYIEGIGKDFRIAP